MSADSQGSSERDCDVERAIAGDQAALERILREVVPELQSSIRVDARWNRSLAVDDILQVTYLEAFLRIETLAQPTFAGFVAWMKRVAANNMIDAVRGLERKKRPDSAHRVTQGADGQSARTLLLSVAGEQATAGSHAAVADEVARMHSAIQQLPPSYRAVVEGVELSERPVAEIAAELGKSPGAIYMLRSRAVERLRELMAVGLDPS